MIGSVGILHGISGLFNLKDELVKNESIDFDSKDYK